METLIVERRPDGVCRVTLNRPREKNAMNGAMFRELFDVLLEVRRTPAIRVLVLTGAGDAFCSGADIVAFGGGGFPSTLDAVRDIHEVALALHQIAKPTLAAVNGVAAGAGLNLALGCDLIVAYERARFSQIFARRGLALDFGGSWWLPRRIGLTRAKELALLADWVEAAEAERIGLVNRVVPHPELEAKSLEWAARLAAGPPLALSLIKRALDDSETQSFAESLEGESRAQAINAASADMREAFDAFREKREPKFSGR
jgi:2-(1,2-epoxy-1,2-dihydrophenyl)acetyl-CoA isomerase